MTEILKQKTKFSRLLMRSVLRLQIPILIFLGSTLYSCNVTRHYIRKSEKQYVRYNAFESSIQLDSSEIHFRKVGAGERNLLLIHGFGPVSQIQWEDLVGELYRNYTIYIPDLIYFGKSTSDYQIYDPRFQARQMYQFLVKQGVSKVTVCGVSYGGMVSSIFANEYPQITERLVLIDALSKYLKREYTDSLAKQYGYESMGQILLPEDGRALKTLFKITFYNSMQYPAFVLNKPARQLYSSQIEDKKRLLEFLYANEAKIYEWDFSYSGPVDIIWGKEDVLIPVYIAGRLHDDYPNSTLMIIPNAAHAVNMENAEEVGEIILRRSEK